MQGNGNISKIIGGILEYKDLSKEANQNLFTPTKGQKVTGIVSKNGKETALTIQGQQVKVSSEILKSFDIGEMLELEIQEISDKTILLKILSHDNEREENSKIKPGAKKNQDQYSFMDKKSRNIKKDEDPKEALIINEILSTMTEHDYEALEAEGISIEKLTIEGLKHALDRIKAKDQGQDRNKVNNNQADNNLSIEALIINKLNQINLPVTDEGVKGISLALSMADSINNINDKAARYLLHNNLDLTIGNIYKSQYSSGIIDGHLTSPITDDTWKELQLQVEDSLLSAGYEINEQNLGDARWLLDNNLPLTKENFDYLKTIDDIKNASYEEILDRVARGIQQGIDPRDVPLKEQELVPYERLMEDIESIEDGTIEEAVTKEEEITIERLVELQRNTSSSNEREVDRQLSINAIKAKRQLEEIRLKMTREAIYKMRSKGFSVETESLEKVVEELKALEEEYYRELFNEAGIEITESSTQLLKNTLGTIEEFKFTPSYVLGATVSTRKEQTITTILEAGNIIRGNLDKAQEAYESLMTMPSSEYGDSIQKAFRNMDSLIQELGLENTEANQRAIRILGYNQIEINKETIEQIKMYDHQVQKLIDNLTPSVAVHLINENIDPLNIPIYELNPMIEDIKDNLGITKEEKYSTYLWKMEKTGGITDSDRKAYIDIYRLLYQISQRDGAALGSVVKANQDITLQNLLTAVKTYKKGSMDVKVDEEFGLLESEEADYYNSIVNKLVDTMTAENMVEATKNIMQQQIGEDSVLSETSSDFHSEAGVWEAIKDIPLEQLLDEITLMRRNDRANSEIYIDKMNQLRELLKNSDQAVRFLNDLKMPTTAANIQMANMILSNEESVFKKLKSLTSQEREENSLFNIKESLELTDNLIDKETMNMAYDQLEAQVKNILEQEYESEVITAQSIIDLRRIGQQMTFLKNLAKREFYQLPLDTGKGITNINLTIIRGMGEAKEVSIAIPSETLGNIKADFSVENQMLKGFISSDSREGLRMLQDNINNIDMLPGLDHITSVNIDFGLKYSKMFTKGYINPLLIQDNTQGETEGEVIENMMSDQDNIQAERNLYSMAKGFIQMVREMEYSQLN